MIACPERLAYTSQTPLTETEVHSQFVNFVVRVAVVRKICCAECHVLHKLSCLKVDSEAKDFFGCM